MKTENDHENEIDETDRPSKSEVKRQMHALTDLGKQLCDLPFEKIKSAPLSERLLEAVREYHRCRSFGAKKRQLMFIGKLMRQEEHEEIAAWMGGETLDQKLQVLTMHAAEQWRDKLLESPESLSALIEAYPGASQMGLNNLIRQAKVERDARKHPKLYRQLYKKLYELIEQAQTSGKD